MYKSNIIDDCIVAEASKYCLLPRSVFIRNLLKMSGQPTEQRSVVKPTASKYVKLNVGGALFNTTIGTLTKQDSMLRAMFSGRMEVLTDSEGELDS